MSTEPRTTPRPRRPAFTMVELLVVIAIIAMLISILLPSLSKAQRIARETVCGADVASLCRVMVTYANEYEGALPDLQKSGSTSYTYPYWITVAWRKTMTFQYGAQRSMWFSPCNPAWNQDTIWFWSSGQEKTATDCVTGRSYLGSASLAKTYASALLDKNVTTRPVFPTRLVDKAAYNLLVTDLSRRYTNSWYFGTSTIVTGHPYTSPFTQPDGSHLGYIDGHSEWADRSQVAARLLIGGVDEIWW